MFELFHPLHGNERSAAINIVMMNEMFSQITFYKSEKPFFGKVNNGFGVNKMKLQK